MWWDEIALGGIISENVTVEAVSYYTKQLNGFLEIEFYTGKSEHTTGDFSGNKLRNKYVIITSKRRFDVTITYSPHTVFAGLDIVSMTYCYSMYLFILVSIVAFHWLQDLICVLCVGYNSSGLYNVVCRYDNSCLHNVVKQSFNPFTTERNFIWIYEVTSNIVIW